MWGDRVFIRNGDTIHFPGVVSAVANINGGTANQLTVQPGTVEVPRENPSFY